MLSGRRNGLIIISLSIDYIRVKIENHVQSSGGTDTRVSCDSETHIGRWFRSTDSPDHILCIDTYVYLTIIVGDILLFQQLIYAINISNNNTLHIICVENILSDCITTIKQ